MNARTPTNTMRLEIPAHSSNESFARSTVAAFASSVNPTLDEINDIKTAVSEAVTNCVVHAYAAVKGEKTIIIECTLYADSLTVVIKDTGVGIKDVNRALEPFFTTRADEERSGMGFTVMQSFMDMLDVKSDKHGTTVTMQKFFAKTGNTSSAKRNARTDSNFLCQTLTEIKNSEEREGKTAGSNRRSTKEGRLASGGN